MPMMRRREILKALPLVLLGARAWRPGVAVAQNLTAGQLLPGTGLIVGRVDPLTAELPISGMTTWITPVERFPILTSIAHSFPDAAPASCTLSIDGQVEQPGSITHEQLRALPSRSTVALIECAGNSRNTVSPPLPSALGVPVAGYIRRHLHVDGTGDRHQWRGTAVRV